MGFASLKDVPASSLDLDAALAAMDALHPDAHARYSWKKLRFLLSEALAGHHTPVFEDTPALPMIRGRAISVRSPLDSLTGSGEVGLIKHVSDLGPVPVSKCTAFGRCHVPGAPVFYASFNEEAVLSELRPALEDIVYLLTCVPKPGVAFRTRLIGEIDYVRRYGRGSVFSDSNPAVAEIRSWLKEARTEADYVRLVTDAFMASLFLRPAGSEEGYRATSALSALLLELEAIDHPGDCEALYYPSVAHRGGMNIVLTRKCFEAKVNPVSCKAILVQRYYGHGIYKTHTLAETALIDDAGNISWPNSKGLSLGGSPVIPLSVR